MRNQSTALIIANDDSIVKLNNLDEAYTKFNDSDNAFLNIEAFHNSKVDIIDPERAKVYQRDNSIISFAL